MIIKEYDLEEEKRTSGPGSVHSVLVEDDGDWIRCKVEYEGKFRTMSFMKEFFGHMHPDDLMLMAVHYVADHL